MTHTANSSQPWWQVDLSEVSTLDSITLYNRTNCCTERLSNFYVLLSDTPFGNSTLTELLNDSSISRTFHTSLSSASLDIPLNGETARYVRVQLQGSNPLSLAEVQVNGVAGTTTSVGNEETTVHYYINDHLSTPQRLVDAAGAISWEATYEAFGKATITTETVTQNHRFPGQYFDQESGLYYNWNRYYDPALGRYVTSDPIGLGGGLNTFGYVGGNPLMYSDPKGLFLFDPEKIEIAFTIGFYDALRISGTEIKARMQSQGFPGRLGGQQDALRHAIWLCLMTDIIGSKQALAVARIHEEHNPPKPVDGAKSVDGYPNFSVWAMDDVAMDNHNNKIGVQLSGSDSSDCGKDKDCKEKAIDALNSGKLKVNAILGYKWRF